MPDRHRGAVAQDLVGTRGVVKRELGRDAGVGLAAIGAAFEIDVLVLERAPQPLDEQLSIQRPQPSIGIRTRPSARIGKLQGEIDKALENNDEKAFDAVVAKLDSLVPQIGPDYKKAMDGLAEVDPNSDEGPKFAAVLDPLHKQCR
jgi:hypothetical protein